LHGLDVQNQRPSTRRPSGPDRRPGDPGSIAGAGRRALVALV